MAPPDSADNPAASGPAGSGKDSPLSIPVVEEKISIDRVSEPTGEGVRVRIEPREEKQRVAVSDMVESVAVERVPLNRFVSERNQPREEGDVLIIPVYETVTVVETRLLLREEIRVTRRRVEVPREEEVVLRKERAVVERVGTDEKDKASS